MMATQARWLRSSSAEDRGRGKGSGRRDGVDVSLRKEAEREHLRGNKKINKFATCPCSLPGDAGNRNMTDVQSPSAT